MEKINRLNLFVNLYDSKDLQQFIPGHKDIRIETYLALRKNDGRSYTRRLLAIIDTGAPISVISPQMWKDAEIEVLGDYDLFGLNSKKECKVESKFAFVKGFLSDDMFNFTQELRFPALLATKDLELTVLGYKMLLEQFTLCCNIQSRLAYLEGDLIEHYNPFEHI